MNHPFNFDCNTDFNAFGYQINEPFQFDEFNFDCQLTQAEEWFDNIDSDENQPITQLISLVVKCACLYSTFQDIAHIPEHNNDFKQMITRFETLTHEYPIFQALLLLHLNQVGTVELSLTHIDELKALYEIKQDIHQCSRFDRALLCQLLNQDSITTVTEFVHFFQNIHQYREPQCVAIMGFGF